MARKVDTWIIISLGIAFILLISVPYLWAYWNSGSDHVFGGFLFNPIDGNSYLAKMYQGWLGSWRYQLPYTSQVGDGGYLFLYYLTLGHITKLVGGSLQATYHIARILGSLVLVIALWNFYSKVLPTHRAKWLAFWLALFGSGLGWLVSQFGMFTSDLWVAEGYPFLAAYANPHFPMGMAILLWIITPEISEVEVRRKKFDIANTIFMIGGSIILGIILPFGVVLAGVILGGIVVWDVWEQFSQHKRDSWKLNLVSAMLGKSVTFRKLVLLLIGGLPVLIYEVWITASDPLLSIWNEQNLTASPALWDLMFSFAPILVIALPGIWLITRKRDSIARILIVWACLGLLLLYIPWSLQRRFILGYMIPLAGLAGICLDFLTARRRSLGLAIICLVCILIIPTNLMIILGGIQAVQTKNPSVLLSVEEKRGLDWIAANSSQDSVILASPQMGLFIPAYSGRRVLYGHPFETVNAKEMEATVMNLFNGTINLVEENAMQDVDYIFYGPRERELGVVTQESGIHVIYSSEDLLIYKVENQ